MKRIPKLTVCIFQRKFPKILRAQIFVEKSFYEWSVLFVFLIAFSRNSEISPCSSCHMIILIKISTYYIKYIFIIYIIFKDLMKWLKGQLWSCFIRLKSPITAFEKTYSKLHCENGSARAVMSESGRHVIDDMAFLVPLQFSQSMKR